jgi:hypothetical protein
MAGNMLSVYENTSSIFVTEEPGERTSRKELFEKIAICNSNGGKRIYFINKVGDYKELLYANIIGFAGSWYREKEDFLSSVILSFDMKGYKDFFLEFDVWEDILETAKEKINRALHGQRN